MRVHHYLSVPFPGQARHGGKIGLPPLQRLEQRRHRIISLLHAAEIYLRMPHRLLRVDPQVIAAHQDFALDTRGVQLAPQVLQPGERFREHVGGHHGPYHVRPELLQRGRNFRHGQAQGARVDQDDLVARSPGYGRHPAQGQRREQPEIALHHAQVLLVDLVRKRIKNQR